MKKLILIPGLILTLLMSQVANAAFSDVDQTTDYETAITWMSDNGVIQGYPDGTFKPDQCVNRAEFLKMMYLTSKKDIITTDSAAGSNYYDNYFSDTSTSEWYWPYVNKALQDGTVVGYPDGTFKPSQCVNRVEAIKMASLEFNNGTLPNDGMYAGATIKLNSVLDIDYNQWYGDYFTYVWLRNLVGTGHVVENANPDSSAGVDRYYDPAGSMTRKEVAEMLYRMKTIKDNSLTVYEEGDTPEPLNFYVSPTSGVSFMMTDGWEVTSDMYYETPGGAVSDYPTIQMKGPNDEILAINLPMMQCEGPLAGQCYELAEGYTLGAGEPSTEAMFLINRMLLTFRVPNVSNETMTSVDSTWNLYTNNDFGFSIKIPKVVTNSAGCFADQNNTTTSPVKVFTDSANNAVYISTEETYNTQCEEVTNSLSLLQLDENRSPAWKIVFSQIQNNSELDQFIKDVYLPECTVVSLQPAEEDGVFIPVLNYGDAGVGCFINWVAYTYYSPSKEKAVHWDVGQDVTFFDGTNTFDEDMGNSFRFE